MTARSAGSRSRRRSRAGPAAGWSAALVAVALLFPSGMAAAGWFADPYWLLGATWPAIACLVAPGTILGLAFAASAAGVRFGRWAAIAVLFSVAVTATLAGVLLNRGSRDRRRRGHGTCARRERPEAHRRLAEPSTRSIAAGTPSPRLLTSRDPVQARAARSVDRIAKACTRRRFSSENGDSEGLNEGT